MSNAAAKFAAVDATFRPAATSALERASMPSTCECCGREGLERTVKMTNGVAVMWMGIGCAAKGTGVSVREINAAEKGEQDRADAEERAARDAAWRAEHARWQAHLDARCPAHKGEILLQIRALGGMALAREGYAG